MFELFCVRISIPQHKAERRNAQNIDRVHISNVEFSSKTTMAVFMLETNNSSGQT